MQRFWVNRRSDIHRFFSNLSYNIQYLRMSRWHITLIYATVLFLFYILFGLILSNDFVDGYFALFATLKELGVVIIAICSTDTYLHFALGKNTRFRRYPTTLPSWCYLFS